MKSCVIRGQQPLTMKDYIKKYSVHKFVQWICYSQCVAVILGDVFKYAFKFQFHFSVVKEQSILN